MAMGGSSYTTVEEFDVFPTLRLTLTDEATALGASRPRTDTNFARRVHQKFKNAFTSARNDANLETEDSEAARARNKVKLAEIFKKLHKELDEVEKEAIESLNGLTPEQQEDVVTFWGAAHTFFRKVFRWLQEMFQKVMDKIRQGLRIVKSVIEEIFETVGNWLRQIF